MALIQSLLFDDSVVWKLKYTNITRACVACVFDVFLWGEGVGTFSSFEKKRKNNNNRLLFRTSS